MIQKSIRYKFFGIATIALFWLIIASIPVQAMLLESWQYPEGTCEKAAKDYQREYGGDLIFLQPLKDDGSFDLGEYNGEFLNKAWNKERGSYYIDYRNQRYFNNTDDIINFYKTTTGKDSVVYNLNQVHPPFGMIWRY